MREANVSDPEFLERLGRRDEAAWETMVEVYLPQLLRTGRGIWTPSPPMTGSLDTPIAICVQLGIHSATTLDATYGALEGP